MKKTTKKNKPKQDKNEKLKISGTFEDVLKIAVAGNPKPLIKKK